MKFLKPGSLSFSLAWKIILIQVTMVAMGLIGMVLMYGDSGAGYIDWKMSESIAKSIHVRDDALHVDWRALDQAAQDRPSTFWFAATDEDGRQVTHGTVRRCTARWWPSCATWSRPTYAPARVRPNWPCASG